MRLQFVSTLLLSGLFGVAGLTHAAALTYTYTPISVPGSSYTAARTLNNAGQIVGAYTDSTGTHGFLYSNGVYTTVDAPGGNSTELLGINNRGQIVGTYVDSSNTPRLFLDNNGVFTTIDPPRGVTPLYSRQFSASSGVAAGINDLGQIVSATFVPNVGTSLGFLYDQGQFSSIPPYTSFSATSFFATGINNAGQISLTGYGIEAGSFVYSNGELTRVSASGGSNSAFGINNAGNIVGVYDGTTDNGGYLYSGSVVTRFDSSSSPNFFRIYGINDAGQLVGGGVGGAVLATPTTAAVPEPTSFVLLGCGMVGFAFVGRIKLKRQQ